MRVKNSLFVAVASLIVSACGGSGGSSTPKPEITTDTETLKSRAAVSIGGEFDGNATAVSRVVNRNRSVIIDTTTQVTVGGSDEFQEDVVYEPVVEDSIRPLVYASLAAGEGSNGTTTRNGNIIDIDPDDNELCNEGLDDVDQMSSEYSNCLEMVKNITVQLVVDSEESGEVNYKYSDQSVVKFGYAPNAESAEINLGGLKGMIESVAVIYNGTEDSAEFPEEFSGSMKFSTVTNNSKSGEEAGSMAWEIVNAITIAATSDGVRESITMDPGKLFEIEADSAAGIGSLSFDIGAIASVFQDDAGLGRFNMAGFSAKADVNPENGTLTVSNLGLSRGPMSMSIANTEIMKMTLENFGFKVTDESEDITIDGNLDLSLMLDNMGGFFEAEDGFANAIVKIMAPTGTAFSRAGNGALMIGGTGPFSVSLGATNSEGESEDVAVTVNAGECLEEFSADAEDMPSADQCL